MKPIAFVTTTMPSKAVSAIGTQRGEHGSTTPSNSLAIAEWLGTKDPADMDRAAVSRASSHGVGLRVRYESRYPVSEDGSHLPGYDVAVGCAVDGSPDAVASALQDLRNFMTPAPMRTIEGWLARLSVVTAKRKDDAFSEELRVVEYSARLSRYPADVVHAVLINQTYKFFPTWDELEKRCETMTGPRRQMIAALERGPEPKDPVRRPPTAEEKDRIQALIDEMFPSVSDDFKARAVAEMTKGNCMAG